MNNAKIVPDLIDHVSDDHTVAMAIKYGNLVVANGNEIKPSEARP